MSLNAAATIDHTLASVALQRTDFALEHICVDGGSTDGTRSIIDRWSERQLNIVRLYEPDNGIFDAMNKGLREARGDYLLFLNADDFLVQPDTLAQALSGIQVDSAGNPDLILGSAVMGEPGRLGVWRHRRVPQRLDVRREWGLYPVHQGQFSKRTLLVAVDGFDAKRRLASDVTQFYELQRRFRPTIRRLAIDVACMRPGGSANTGLHAMLLGTVEIHQHLRSRVGRLKATAMVLVKTLQSLSELRLGRCPHRRWFVA